MRLWLAATSGIRWVFLHTILPHPSLSQLSLIAILAVVVIELPAGLCTSSRVYSRSLLSMSTVQLWLTGATCDTFVSSFRSGP
ncbi:hypothetical protein JB92DRAFT_2890227 [Gautieria morchelliformis]|nr:hypothetical protein JB92DRAFT_2890227 [Gautieria morchelliformis]